VVSNADQSNRINLEYNQNRDIGNYDIEVGGNEKYSFAFQKN